MNDPSAANAALTAFLRGVERRGAVFAEWQGGDPEAGDAALASTLRGFRDQAGGTAFAEWPRRFWAMLLAAPQLRQAVPKGAGTAPAAVATLGVGPRAALLLRLVAGLAEAEAAAVLGIARPTYRLALQRALPHRGDGSPDPEAWRALSAAAQQAVRALPQERLETIEMLRDGLRPRPPVRQRPAPRDGARRRAGWVWPATVVVLVLVASALGATWWGPWLPGQVPPGAAGIQVEPLPPVEPPAARFDPADALASHRDLDLLLAQATGAFADDADPAFDAWLVTVLEAGEGDEESGATGGEPVDARP
ncbi:hypothetical protein [Luteimonas kalidii]|uniref:RNA polymerase sigma factor 70 region 4 type 2 domain-containing protein n=1 Tax=Luteimonas kalidii TaxID=3042025 RepID=A0ABT6JUC0_9GAMM|nr:hypothetical protein [Luteimonas kalidii]MDH5834289.1 hypothetical protein [Luteimonas kalidii]